LIHPKYYYRFAKLYKKKGWAGKAIENYADLGIADVENAKKKLAGLKSK